MTHIAIQETDETGSPVTWGRRVTDDEYHATPPTSYVSRVTEECRGETPSVSHAGSPA
jgi:hypothetical protein